MQLSAGMRSDASLHTFKVYKRKSSSIIDAECKREKVSVNHLLQIKRGRKGGTYDAFLFLFIVVSFLPVIRQLSLEMPAQSLKDCSQSRNSLFL